MRKVQQFQCRNAGSFKLQYLMNEHESDLIWMIDIRKSDILKNKGD